MAQTKTVKTKIVKLDLHKINDPAAMSQWDQVWAKMYELRTAISRSRQSNQTISVQVMQEYEQARNEERQFFWDNFYHQEDD
jgi:patatin-like phospholipase/acyl hydrolase